jgi:hypothetical protein
MMDASSPASLVAPPCLRRAQWSLENHMRGVSGSNGPRRAAMPGKETLRTRPGRYSS